MTYYPYIVLFHHILGSILVVFSLKFSIPILLHRKFISNNYAKLSPVLIHFFVFSIIWSFAILINKIYSIAFWRPNENLYNAFVLYWTGFFPQILAFLETTLEIFLCIDRCLSVLFSLKYTSRIQKLYSFFTLFGLAFYLGIFLTLNDLFQFIPTSSTSNCVIFDCFLQKKLPNYVASRFIMIFLNIFCGCILLFLVKIEFKNSNNEKNKHLSNTVMVIIAISSFSEVFPAGAAHYFMDVHNLRLNDIIGPFAPTCASLNILISAWLYSKAFRETFKLYNDVKVGVASNKT